MAVGMSMGLAYRVTTIALAQPDDDKMQSDGKMKDDKMKDDTMAKKKCQLVRKSRSFLSLNHHGY
jgi:hypothetical protein